MDVLSEADCTDGVPGNDDVVPDNLDICVRDDNHGGDTQICFVWNILINTFLYYVLGNHFAVCLLQKKKTKCVIYLSATK